MKETITIRVANPAGNITIFVMDPFPRSRYQEIASQLLAMEELRGEQVAFITGENSMEMCGLEFCGNASRSFALMLAHSRGVQGCASMEINVSGCSHPLVVDVDTQTDYTRVSMPLPLSVTEQTGGDVPELLRGGCIVNLDGIVHAVVKDVPAAMENFAVIRDHIERIFDPPASGVMFLDSASGKMTPVVYVRDVDTTYFEGSCGSGATAVAAAFCSGERDGTFSYTLPQPAGTITATAEKKDGRLLAVYIEGPVEIGPPVQVEIG